MIKSGKRHKSQKDEQKRVTKRTTRHRMFGLMVECVYIVLCSGHLEYRILL